MDLKERHLALDTKQSFIVQAPAGSGKTELLTQRFLALLATVNNPEEILALTFTKKAAQEMRHRILSALQEARLQVPLKSQHQQQTRALAINALNQNTRFDWHLLEHPHRLKVTTFDAFCLEIYQSMPLEQQANIPNLSDYPEYAYRQAIQNWFNWCRAEPLLHPHLKILLKSVGNKQDTLFSHLINLIKKRDQWLMPLQYSKTHDEAFHHALLESILLPFWQQWTHCLPMHLKEDVLCFIGKAWSFIEKASYPNLRNWQHFDDINKEQLIELRKLLLKADDTIRSSFDHNNFFKKEYGTDAKLFPVLKEESAELLSCLAEYPEFVDLIVLLGELPSPDQLQIDWQLLNAYYQLLPLLVAHLHLEFETQLQADFIYVAQHAKLALEETEMGLYFDNQLHHLLIDEFQDTSWPQLDFIHQLTDNWDQQPHKTMFVVGDPMQSIYRFRSADVGIFLNIQQQGFKHIKPVPIYLKQNFRSAPEIIHSLNQQFSEIFPKKEDIHLGGVTFHQAHPAVPEQEHAGIVASYFENTEQQNAKILEIIQKALTEKIPSLAILVRERKQLQPILQMLKQNDISYQGVDLVSMGKIAIIRDVWNLTQLLLRPKQRIHELVVLRGPLVGLSLKELESLCQACPKGSLIEYLSKKDALNRFVPETQKRLSLFITHLQYAQNQQHLQAFGKVIQQLTRLLGLPHLMDNDEQQTILKFYNILDQFSGKMAWPDAKLIEDYLEQIFVSSNQALNLQVMTIHKSKGLEFDWVILPNLGDVAKPIKLNALEWLNCADLDATLFFPTESELATSEEQKALLKWFETQQTKHETQRLCYVAMTRAKHQLFLLDDKEKAAKKSFRSLFPKSFFTLGSLAQTPENHNSNKMTRASYIKRLPQSFYTAQEPIAKINSFLTHGEEFEDNFWQKQIGIITHRLLQWICEFHPTHIDDIPWQIAQSMLSDLMPPAYVLPYIKKMVQGFWNCPHGEWVKKARHFEHNEYALLIQDDDITRQAILDRTFIDDETLWVIDFKTSGEHSEFKDQYIQQLERYAQHMHGLFPKLSVHCGIYFLSDQQFHHWSYQKAVDMLAQVP